MNKELLKRVIAECSDEGSRSNITPKLYGAIAEYLEMPEPEYAIPVYTTPPDQSARIAELEKDNNLTHENLAWYMAKYYEHLKIIQVLRDILIRYRNETPIGHQPHMIAHEVDNALAAHSIEINHE